MTTLYVAQVNQVITNNATWQFAFQFGVPSDLSWNFDHCILFSDVKAEASDDTPLLATSSENGLLIILDLIARIIQYNVPPLVIQDQLPVGDYVYDLIMVNNTTYDTQQLMTGTITVIDGPTKEQ